MQKIISWNVNSLRQRYSKGAFLSIIDEKNPDIICLQETKVTHDTLPMPLKNHLLTRGYIHQWFSPLIDGKYGGVAVLSKINPVVIYPDGLQEIPDSPGRIALAEFEHFSLMNSYFPTGTLKGKPVADTLKEKLQFLDNVISYLQKTKNSGKPVILCGDFNIAHRDVDLHDPPKRSPSKRVGITQDERERMDRIVKSGFFDPFAERTDSKERYTWWSARNGCRKNDYGWRLDYFFVSEALRKSVITSDILSGLEEPDHCPISLEMDI